MAWMAQQCIVTCAKSSGQQDAGVMDRDDREASERNEEWEIPGGCFSFFLSSFFLSFSPGWPQAHYVAEDGVKLLPAPKCQGYRHIPSLPDFPWKGFAYHIQSSAQAGSCPRDSIRRLSDNHILCAHRNLLCRQHYQQRNGGFPSCAQGMPHSFPNAHGLRFGTLLQNFSRDGHI